MLKVINLVLRGLGIKKLWERLKDLDIEWWLQVLQTAWRLIRKVLFF